MCINEYIDYENDSINEEKTNFYIDAKNIDIILKQIIDLNICEQKKLINSLLINIDEQSIIEYLHEQFENQNLKKEYLEQINMLDTLNGYYKFAYLRQLLSNNVIRNYVYDPYTFEYLKKYITILRNKLSKIIFIIENIKQNNFVPIKEIINDLDITLIDEKILFSDIIRLAIPLKSNISELKKKVRIINDLNTYMYLKKSDDIDYNRLYYPSEELQIDTLLLCSEYVPLTQNQKYKLRQRNNNSIKTQIKILCKNYD